MWDDELRDALGPDAVVTDPDILAAHARDEAGLCAAGTPAGLVRPTSTEQVQQVVRVAGRHGIPIVPQGARTGLSGAANAVDGCILLSTQAMNRIIEIDPVNRLAVVQPGVVNADISRAGKEHGLRYAPDPGSYESSTIGGNVATNAGGMCCVKYGVTTEYVLELEVVLADGEVLRCGRRTVKGVAGYDLVRLFTGSEGTLGIITQITVRLQPIPRQPLTLAAVFPSTSAAGRAVTAITAAGAVPSLMELIDQVHLRAIEDYRPMGLDTKAAALLLAASDSGVEADLDEIAALCSEAGATEVYRATDAAEADALLAARRLAYPAVERLGTVIVDDIAVPRSRLGDALDGIAAAATKHGVQIGVIAHAGDGNLHPNIIVDGGNAASVASGQAAFDDIMRLAFSLGGTCTGEHGVGLLKRDWLAAEAGAVGMRVQQAVKDALDPHGLFNPGKMFPATATERSDSTGSSTIELFDNDGTIERSDADAPERTVVGSAVTHHGHRIRCGRSWPPHRHNPRPRLGREATTMDPILVIGETVADATTAPPTRHEVPLDLAAGRPPRLRLDVHPGGSPANVAVALARLGTRVRFAARLSDGVLGRLVRRHLTASGVDLSDCVDADGEATLALAALDSAGRAQYSFYVDKTVDWQWKAAELPAVDDRTPAVHSGSLALAMPPGCEPLTTALAGYRAQGAAISIDPNARPGIVSARRYRSLLPAWIATADILKLSDEDLDYIYPGADWAECCADWHRQGVGLVILTRGAAGAVVSTADHMCEVPGYPVHPMADTIGAGDAFTGGLLHHLAERDLLRNRLAGLDRDGAVAAVRFAARVAAAACRRPGADPPWAGDLANTD